MKTNGLPDKLSRYLHVFLFDALFISGHNNNPALYLQICLPPAVQHSDARPQVRERAACLKHEDPLLWRSRCDVILET